MSRTLELGFIIGSTVAGALTGFAKVMKGLKEVKDNTDNLVKTAKKLENFDKAREKLNNINKEYLESVAALKKLKDEYNRSGKGNAEFAKRVKEAEKHVSKLNDQKQKQWYAFQKARSAIEAEGFNLKTYRDELYKVNKELETQNKLKKIQAQHEKRTAFADKMGESGDRMLKRGAVAGAAVAAPLKIFMDVEESQADLRKMLGDEAQKYYGELRKISDNSPLSQPQVFEIAGSLAQSGISGDDIVEYTAKANQIAVAFDMGTREAGEFLAKTKAQLGLGTQELFQYADTINYLADTTAAQANQITEVSQRVASLGGIAGVSKESVAAFGATLVSIGKTPEIAATGLKQLYGDLMAGTAATKSQKAAFEALGLEAEQVAKNMIQDGEGTIIQVLSRIKQLPQHLQAATIKQLFGNEAIDSVSGLAENLDLLKKNLENSRSEMANAAVEKEYSSRMKTLSNQLKTSWNQVKNSLADLGMALAPTIKSLLEQSAPIIKFFADFIKQNPKLTAGIMKAVGSFAAFSLGMGGVLKISSGLIKMWSSLASIFAKIKVAGGLTKAFPILAKMGPALMNPWVLAGAVIVGVFVLLYNKSKWFRDGIQSTFKEIAPHVKELANILKNNIGKAIIAVKNLFQQSKPGMLGTWNALKPAIEIVVNLLKGSIIAAIQNIISMFTFMSSIVQGAFQMISSSFKTTVAIWKGIISIFIAFFTGKWGEIPGIASRTWEAVKSGISGFIEGAKTLFSGFATFVVNKFSEIKNSITSGLGALKAGNWARNAAVNSNIEHYQLQQNYAGTNYWKGGLTTVAERGAELIKIPGQSPFLAQSEMLLNLPKGTQILNNFQTRNSLRDKVLGLRDRISGLRNRDNVHAGGDNITIQIIGGNNSPADIAKEVEKILRERDNRKRRVSFG